MSVYAVSMVNCVLRVWAIAGRFATTANSAQSGSMALICAAENGHTNCVRLLIEAGADKEARDGVRDVAV
jgi:hypothetical protein